MPPRVDSVALLERTMQMIRETHAHWDEDQVLECAFSVMNLQPNTNQAEKIPKSVLSIISQIVKLNENNWAIWEPMCHGPECTGSEKAVGPYGRSIGVRDQADPQKSRPWQAMV
ncbi:uncharacterized protein UHOD_11478 [Ustilago sp. UG-2017b]|nr:uncharacterized protein UHOD_11478 [Ustilago sp. UG-2017b]